MQSIYSDDDLRSILLGEMAMASSATATEDDSDPDGEFINDVELTPLQQDGEEKDDVSI